MCGIAGITGSGQAAAVERMTEALRHRGPDQSGFYRSDEISLGQRRLSIIDLAGGQQPISNEDGTLQLVCNGEIYNSPELRRQLISRGHVFKTGTDVEVIVHLYEDKGRDCVRDLRGMFSFALWDATQRSLMLARDHLGQKPLFYWQRDGRLVFASEAKGVLASGLMAPEIDLDGLWHYVSLRYLPDQYSLFQGIRKLPAATSLVWKDGEESLERYWCPDFVDKRRGDERAIVEELDSLLRETVELHLLSDVPVGSFLSGGIDSSLVTAMMAEITEQPFPTFSIGVKEQGFNELPFARQVSSRFGLQAREKVVEADMIHLIPSMVHYMDEPADPFGAGVFLVAREAAAELKVVLGGDGGDENFAGYDRYFGNRLVDTYCMIPAGLRRSVLGRLFSLVPDGFGYKSLAQKLAWLNDMSLFEGGERYARSLSFLRFTHEAKQRLFTDRARQQIEDYDSSAKVLAFYDASCAEEAVDRMLYTDLMTRMPDHLLTIADRMTMAHSLEARSPLIDHKIVEYAASLPTEMKLKGRNLKYVLRQVAARYLPAELITREKQGFGFPIARWMRSDLRRFLRNLLAESRFVEMGLFEGDYVGQLVEEHLDGKVDHNFRLWILLNLEIWHRLYFENQTVESLNQMIDEMC